MVAASTTYGCSLHHLWLQALESVHLRHREELKAATDVVAREREKLAEAMAKLADDEEQGRVLADFRRESASGQVHSQ